VQCAEPSEVISLFINHTFTFISPQQPKKVWDESPNAVFCTTIYFIAVIYARLGFML
jgi:hypothetical protein